MPHEIIPTQDKDRDEITDIIAREWGIPIIVKNRTFYPQDLPGFKAVDEDSGEISGLITYNIFEGEAEIVTLNSFKPNMGIGTALIRALAKAAKEHACRRIWLITTNDNVDAIRFYQMRKFRLVAIYRGAVDESRKTKKEIPETGMFGIGIHDEIEMELDLG